MECPNCGLLNPATAQRCDCGFDFSCRTMKGSLLSPAELRRASEDPNPVYLPFGDVFVRLFKWLYQAVTGEARRRGKFRAAYKRATRFGSDGDEVR